MSETKKLELFYEGASGTIPLQFEVMGVRTVKGRISSTNTIAVHIQDVKITCGEYSTTICIRLENPAEGVTKAQISEKVWQYINE